MKPTYVTRSRIYQDERPKRRAYLADFAEPIVYGMHGGVKDFYRVESDEEAPSTLDHFVAAAAG